jgi:predicted TIM-barrel fold metal-dependent hydrolase
VINLSKLPRVHMKVSSLTEKDKPTVKSLYDAYGPDRLIWGSYGNTQARFEATLALIDHIFDYAPEADRVKIRGLNAMKLFGFPLRG